MTQKKYIPKIFLLFGLVLLLCSLFVYIVIYAFGVYALNQQPINSGIFYQDSITVAIANDTPERDCKMGNQNAKEHFDALCPSQSTTISKVVRHSLEDEYNNYASKKLKDEQHSALVPVGITVGVRFYTQGIMVLATGEVEDKSGIGYNPSEGKIFAGDIITKANGKEVKDIEELIKVIDASYGAVNLSILRDAKPMQITIYPEISSEDGQRRIGCWVRDSTQGIGTITYYDPSTGLYGALGHGIVDIDTKKLMAVKEGNIFESNIVDIKKGQKGAPGELIGEIMTDNIIGSITKNTKLGIFGNINTNYEKLPKNAMWVANRKDIYEGPAKIRSNIEGGEIKEYDIFIESINPDITQDKGLVVRITDQGLITRTNGIVQGMSGSPILQGGKIVGAITHVFVQNPLRGYGVFIENMQKEVLSVTLTDNTSFLFLKIIFVC